MIGALHVRSRSAGETGRVGAAIAGCLVPGDVLLLSGQLGAGKTTLVQGLVAALGSTEIVTSPTFTLMRTYDTVPPVAHVDCWRLSEPLQVVELALEEELDDGSIAVIEWGDLAREVLGEDAFLVSLSAVDARTRDVTIGASGPRTGARLAEIETALGSAGLAPNAATVPGEASSGTAPPREDCTR